MKTFLVLLAFVALTVASNAQGTLEFNQVKFITSSETVPSGKVWKVTSFIPSEVFRDGPAARTYLLGINGSSRTIGHSAWQYASYATSGPMTFVGLPLWFAAGTSLDPAVSSSFLYAINVIEFNVIP